MLQSCVLSRTNLNRVCAWLIPDLYSSPQTSSPSHESHKPAQKFLNEMFRHMEAFRDMVKINYLPFFFFLGGWGLGGRMVGGWGWGGLERVQGTSIQLFRPFEKGLCT